MNNDEIRALADETKATIASFNPPLGPHALVYRLADAIETLLARQAQALNWAKGKHGVISAADVENGYFIAAKTDIVYDQLRAILEPENEHD